jgi:hypothetical protein
MVVGLFVHQMSFTKIEPPFPKNEPFFRQTNTFPKKEPFFFARQILSPKKTILSPRKNPSPQKNGWNSSQPESEFRRNTLKKIVENL